MDLDNLIDIFKVEVLRNRPELNDFSEGSVLYTLARSVAFVINEVYYDIDRLKQVAYILDKSNIDEGLIRSISPTLIKEQGTVAQGYVLVRNLDYQQVTLPTNTVLTDPISLQQYIVLSEVVISSLLEVQVEVRSVEVGSNANIPAGRNLVNVNYPRLVFTVGEYRAIDNTIQGNITNGTSIESNNAYYSRITDRLFHLRVTQKQVLIDYLINTYEEITSVSIETLTGGLVLIWINSTVIYTEIELQEINTAIQDYIPIGTFSQVNQLIIKSISITIQTYEETTTVIDNKLKEVITNYVNSIKPTGVLSVTAIRNRISEQTGLIIKVLSPTANITLNSNEKFSISNLEVVNVIPT